MGKFTMQRSCEKMNIHFLTVFLYKTTDRKINKYPFTLAFSLGLEYDCNLTKRKQENRNW
jgi:hypothetical protein